MADKKDNKKSKKNANNKPSIIQRIGKFFHDYNVERKKNSLAYCKNYF